GSVGAGAIRAGLVAGGTQPGLEIPDRLARCPLPQEGLEAAGYRNSASSWTSWPLPLAPIMRFLATPSWNSTSVGMLMISYRRATSGDSSTSTLTMRSFPSYSVASSSRMGAISLHGPHHSAQKSTRTGWSEELISSSKVASVRAVRELIGSGS